MTSTRYRWAASGDVNAFFGLMLDNVADLLLMVGLMSGAFDFPAEFALRYMIPGTAIGVFVGDLLFFFLAFRLAARSGRNDITAMPLGLDTPSTFGMVFFILGPCYINALKTFPQDPHAAAMHTWHVGVCCILLSGLFKCVCSLGSNWIRKSLPRAGLLGSLAAIATAIISFLPLVEILGQPFLGLLSLAIILTTLVARVTTPWRVPGAVVALLVGGTMYWLREFYASRWGTSWDPEFIRQWQGAYGGLMPREWLTVFSLEWREAWRESLQYSPIVLPFALATVVGGIDCTESAAAVGDDYDTGQVIGVEAIATLVAALCGGVIQTTPYIGHPAYKTMGGRAAYTLATAIFVGLLGVTGTFSYLYLIIPKPTVFPILVFIGLEITAQSYLATPKRHYPAVALAIVPALAALVVITCGKFGVSVDRLSPEQQHEYLVVTMLYNGFIVTSLIWASALAYLIDLRLPRAALFFFIAALLTGFGIMHSPLPGGALFYPWALATEHQHFLPLIGRWAGGYAAIAVLLLAWSAWLRANGLETPLIDDEAEVFGAAGHGSLTPQASSDTGAQSS